MLAQRSHISFTRHEPYITATVELKGQGSKKSLWRQDRQLTQTQWVTVGGWIWFSEAQCEICWCHRELCNFKVVLVQGSVGSGQGEDRCRTRKRLCHSMGSSQAAGRKNAKQTQRGQSRVHLLSIPWCIHNMARGYCCSCFRCPSFYYPDEAVIALSDLCIWKVHRPGFKTPICLYHPILL